MLPADLIRHGQHVMTVCNACRYCEAYCPVFPAMEKRSVFSDRDLTYLANLCHNCGECLYACPYAPPHEFAINVPQTFASIRVQSYEEYSWPGFFRRGFSRSRVATTLSLVASVLVILAVCNALSNRSWRAAVPGGDFYQILPHNMMVTLFGGVGLFVLVALTVGGLRFWREVKTDDLGQAIGPALRDALTLRHLHSQGIDCSESEDLRRPWRRWFHHVTFYGFALCFASTSIAALYHLGFGWRAPYAYTSLPVLFGTVGGLALLVGPAGLMALRRTRDEALGDLSHRELDTTFAILLFGTSATGLALLVFRQGAAMPALLTIHLALVLALFLTLPYGKFVHGIYRFLAVVKYHAEAGGSGKSGGAHPSPEAESLRSRPRNSEAAGASGGGAPRERRMVILLGYIFFFELGDLNSFAFAAPAIRETWHLSIATTSQIISASFVGMFLGATTAGWFSDRVGRKRALIATTIWYSTFSLLNAFVWNVPGLYATRLLTGVGLSAMTVVAMTYISEMFPAEKRGSYQAWIMTIGLCGIPATAFVARFLVPLAPWTWRLVFVWGSLALFFPLFAGKLEESSRWLERHASQDQGSRLEAQTALPSGPGGLFLSGVRGRTVLLIAIWVCQTLGFYGFNAWVPTLLTERGFSIVRSLEQSSVMQIGAVPGAWIAATIADRWERKSLIAIVALVVAACGITYGLSSTTSAIVIFGFLVAMGQQVFAPLLYTYTPECFPTDVRNTGAGVSYGIGRLGNAFGPLIVAYLFTHYGYSSVFVYIATCWALVALVITLFGPKTRGRSLA